MKYCIGQRWASHTETQLGLGIITQVDGRIIHISFPASGETRVYAADTAPLSRINYGVGDQVSNMDEDSFTIAEAHEKNNLFFYVVIDSEGNQQQLDELDLSCFVQFTSPQQRLFNGQVDKNKHFDLRVKTLDLTHKVQQSPARGLLGNRTELLAHQVYIANEVAQRYAPRVLLADEVGLGKTIEAGMILHYQIQSGQASRVLILVPDSLVHQWLVEMRRRFNLQFSIYDHERLLDNIEAGFENPFEAEQLVLCPLSLITDSDDNQAFAGDCHWDMVVVDEAHHLLWSETEPSRDYLAVEALATNCEGLLLLTATPEQVGIEGHFARLRLLDPARFHSLEQFKTEQDEYTAINALVTRLQEEGLTAEVETQFAALVDATVLASKDKDAIIAQLLDRHGTGRVFFRNTRAAVKGFPERCPLPVPLALPSEYKTASKDTVLDEGQTLSADESLEAGLYPERQLGSDDWLAVDPRVSWLVTTLKSLQQEKVLVICHHASTALTLDNYLNHKVGIRSTAFYEGLSIIERDRAAAYFSEGSGNDDDAWGIGAQVLVCSEIGSEGRNFQFAHHLVLFDLPFNPDLLEQRIGRLDRIGQKHDIQLHIPYIEESAQAILFQFYHRGMNLFSRSCSVAFSIYKQYANVLHRFIEDPTLAQSEQSAFEQLLKDTQESTDATLLAMQQGRDQLIELNSCKPDIADQLIANIEANENSDELADYMETVFDHFHVESDYHSENSLIIHATDRTQVHFPGLKEDGNTITFKRKKAVVREDMDFLSWEHPIVSEAMELLYKSELGNTALATIAINGLPQGALLVEAIYTMDTVAEKYLQLNRYLPTSPTRFVIDQQGKNFAEVLPHDKLSSLCKPISTKIIPAVIEQTKSVVLDLLEHAKKLAAEKTALLRTEAQEKLHVHVGQELSRLESLKLVNSSIRGEEIDFLKDTLATCKNHIERAELSLNALRIIINQPKK